MYRDGKGEKGLDCYRLLCYDGVGRLVRVRFAALYPERGIRDHQTAGAQCSGCFFCLNAAIIIFIGAIFAVFNYFVLD